MQGEVTEVWSETWRAIWSRIAKHGDAPNDIFCELYREIVTSFKTPPTANELADIIDQPGLARIAFRSARSLAFISEMSAVEFLERAYAVMIDLGGDRLGNRYFRLVEGFLRKYGLRYDIRRPFTLHPTLTGVFSRLVRELKTATERDAGLHPMMLDFEEAIRDLRHDRSAGKIKTCIQKQMNLLEALGQLSPGVTGNTLGQICNQVGTWPHEKLKDAMKNIYGFASDYPGIRHGGTASSKLREIEMRDLVGVAVMLSGFSPYLTHLINSDNVYCEI